MAQWLSENAQSAISRSHESVAPSPDLRQFSFDFAEKTGSLWRRLKTIASLKNFAALLSTLAGQSCGAEATSSWPFRPQDCEGDEPAFCSKECAHLSAAVGQFVGEWIRLPTNCPTAADK